MGTTETERNSESMVAKISGIAALVAIAAQGVVLALVDTPLVEQWPWLVMVNTVLGLAAKVAWEYVKTRPGKTAAIAARISAESIALSASTGRAPDGR